MPKSSASEGMNRREFLIGLGALASSFLLPENRASAEQLKIIPRETWDNSWANIKGQYALKIGEKFNLSVGDRSYEHHVNILPYLDSKTLKPADLKKVLRRIIMHESAIIPVGDAGRQGRDIRDVQIGQMGYNDVAYHFIIASDGSILQGRPLERVGAHAGTTKESDDYKNRNIPGDVPEIAQAVGDEYRRKLSLYIKAMQMDPDYGSVGVCLCGNFDHEGRPSKQQATSLATLLNNIKSFGDIPSSNILYHREVKSQVVEASGLTFTGSETACPGNHFMPKTEVLAKLSPDSASAKTKTVLLDKYID